MIEQMYQEFWVVYFHYSINKAKLEMEIYQEIEKLPPLEKDTREASLYFSIVQQSISDFSLKGRVEDKIWL